MQFAQTKSHSDGLHRYHKSYEKHNSLSQQSSSLAELVKSTLEEEGSPDSQSQAEVAAESKSQSEDQPSTKTQSQGQTAT